MRITGYKDGLILQMNGNTCNCYGAFKGRKLVTNLPEDVKKVFAECNRGQVTCRMGIKVDKESSQVNVVLSGMSDEAQVEDNIRIASDSYAKSLQMKNWCL
jgi:predicted aldo/keto reductase-like oxidoreductase